MSYRRCVKSRRYLKISSSTTDTFEPVPGEDMIRKNGIDIRIPTKLFNICAKLEYFDKSMEELRFEHYTNNRHLSSTTTDQTRNILSLPLFGTNSVTSTISGCFTFGTLLPPPTLSPTSLFTFGDNQPKTTSTFDFASAIKELNERIHEMNKNKTSETVRSCADCENLPQMQYLHCSKQICMECAQKHVDLTAKEVEAAEQLLTTKVSVLDKLVVTAKERVNIERDKIIQQADTERDQALIQIDKLYERLKKQLEDKHTQLHQLSLDKVSPFIKRMTDETEDFNEDNQEVFHVVSTPPKIQVEHKHSSSNPN